MAINVEFFKTNYKFLAFFIAAFLLGAAIKLAVAETITMGFDDYKLAPKKTLYNLNAMQRKFMRGR